MTDEQELLKTLVIDYVGGDDWNNQLVIGDIGHYRFDAELKPGHSVFALGMTSRIHVLRLTDSDGVTQAYFKYGVWATPPHYEDARNAIDILALGHLREEVDHHVDRMDEGDEDEDGEPVAV